MSKQLGNTPRHPLAAGLLAGLLCGGIAPALAQQGPPNFSASNMGWVSVGGEWTRVPGSPPPVGQDPALIGQPCFLTAPCSSSPPRLASPSAP